MKTKQDYNNNNIPLVSISCITYQHAPYIRQCLDGFLMQRTDFAFEVLIHDDASTDGTEEIIREYEAKFPDIIKPLYEEENQWVKGRRGSKTFNYPRAKGKYIALCEGDDYWTDPLKLQKQVDFLEENEEYVVTSHDAKIVDENGNLIKESKLPDELKRDFSAEEIKKGAWLLTLSMCFRNVLPDFPKEMMKVRNGDTFLISLLGSYGKGKYLGDIKPAIYRAHDGGVWSKKNNLFKLNSNLNTLWQLRNYYKRIGDLDTQAHFENLCKRNSDSYLGAALSSRQLKDFAKAYSFYFGVHKVHKDFQKFIYLNKNLAKFFLQA